MIYIVEKQFLDENHVDYGKIIFYAEFRFEGEAKDFANTYNRHEARNGEIFTIRSEPEHYIED